MTKEPSHGLMNIYSMQLDKWISIIFSIFVAINQIMCFSNLMAISPSENWLTSIHRSLHKFNQSVPVYTRDQLLNMSSNLKQIKYCILPFEIIEII